MSAPTASTMRAASAIVRGIGAEELDGERMLVGGDAEIPERLLVAVLDPGAADHLRADEPRAVAASLAPKGLDADTRHGGEHEPRRDLDGADLPRFAKVDHGRRMVLAGCLTLLERGSYHSRPLSGPEGPAVSSLEGILREGRDPHSRGLQAAEGGAGRADAPRSGVRSPSASPLRASSARSPRTRSTTTRRTSR